MNLAEFARWAITEGPFQGYGLDGADVQNKAIETGILSRTKYDPEIHGENDFGVELGDDWFVFSAAFKAALESETESADN